MSYLTAHRYGLVKVTPNETERQGGWRQVWEHPSGLRAAKNPATGRWHVIEGREIRDAGFCSSLRAAANKIDRYVARTKARDSSDYEVAHTASAPPPRAI